MKRAIEILQQELDSKQGIVEKYKMSTKPIWFKKIIERHNAEINELKAAIEILNESCVAASINIQNSKDKKSMDWWHKRRG